MVAHEWYLERDEPDVAERLLFEAARAVERLGAFAHSFQVMYHTPSGIPIRRLPFKKLPYMFVYTID